MATSVVRQPSSLGGGACSAPVPRLALPGLDDEGGKGGRGGGGGATARSGGGGGLLTARGVELELFATPRAGVGMGSRATRMSEDSAHAGAGARAGAGKLSQCAGRGRLSSDTAQQGASGYGRREWQVGRRLVCVSLVGGDGCGGGGEACGRPGRWRRAWDRR